MSSEVYDDAIIGTGLTGLNLARELQTRLPKNKTILFEKSNCCGGRMATRRVNEIKFDHGAQFIKKSALSEKLIHLWQAENVARVFPSDKFDGLCGKAGITQLAKKLAEPLNITYQMKVIQLHQSKDFWEVAIENAPSVRAKRVSLTAPLPQSIEILKNSGLIFDPDLSKLLYAKAIVLLIEASSDFGAEFNYQEKVSVEIFSICAQHAKGNSTTPAWTIVMTDHWSQQHFDLTDDEILLKAKEVISNQWRTLQMAKIHVKKWRYCQPQTIWKNLFENPQPNLYLAGDAFGGPSLLGALKSSYGLAQHLHAKYESTEG